MYILASSNASRRCYIWICNKSQINFVKNSLLIVEREQIVEAILYQLDQLLLSLHIFVRDHGNDAPRHLAEAGVGGGNNKKHININSC